MKIVLLNPDIPQNTGNIGRTCIANDIELILVGRLGFELSDTKLKRAGLDYWKHIKLKVYKSFDEFLFEVKSEEQFLFFSTHGKKLFWDVPFNENSYLIFGSETKGYPPEFYERYIDKMYRIPMKSEKVRSLNLATSCGIVLYHAIYRLNMDH
ncbi:MAG: tRNA (cytidine(34)-2'-O)-methyltransferase [Elusimicrobia bacterium]|nr:tRNA (cytidine(34)-2'-O)-methyltransferase [Elusimicrobiota bacterium]